MDKGNFFIRQSFHNSFWIFLLSGQPCVVLIFAFRWGGKAFDFLKVFPLNKKRDRL